MFELLKEELLSDAYSSFRFAVLFAFLYRVSVFVSRLPDLVNVEDLPECPRSDDL